MAFNLFISYDLDKPGQNYDAVHERSNHLADGTTRSSHSFMCTLRALPRKPIGMCSRLWTATTS